MPGFDFSTTTLARHPQGAAVQRILSAALQAVDPGDAVRAHLHREGGRLLVGPQENTRLLFLDDYTHVYVVGAGKAGAPMALAALECLGAYCTAGVVIIKEGHAAIDPHIPLPPAWPRLALHEAGHPLPDARGLAATRQVLDLLEGATERDLVLCLISGGGSALLTRPALGISLDDLQELTSLLLASGASINEINTLRKHLDLVKGGGLARAASPAELVTLVLSDVVGDPLDIIASGPTVADASTFGSVWAILERYALVDRLPEAVRSHLLRGREGKLPDTPKSGDPIFERVQHVIVGSNRLAAGAALAQARQEGFYSLLLTTYLQGEARQAGRFLASIARQQAASGEPLPGPACLLAGGETTVTLLGRGRGGRNQELALGAVEDLAGLPDVLLVTLATDGGDGPTDAAGAVVSGDTLARADAAGLSVPQHLLNNDAYSFFNGLGDLLKPGPTQTNVNDLAFLFTTSHGTR